MSLAPQRAFPQAELELQWARLEQEQGHQLRVKESLTAQLSEVAAKEAELQESCR